jgi:hypothetical protein
MNAAPNAWQLERVISLAMSTIEELRTEHGQVFSQDDDETLLASLAEEGVDVNQIIRRLVRAGLDAKASAAAADQRIDDLTARRDRFRRQAEKYRETVKSVMQELGLRNFPDAEFSLSLSPGQPKVIVTDESKLSDQFVTVTVTRTPDKVMIKQALYDNGEVPGAILTNPGFVLTVRTK